MKPIVTITPDDDRQLEEDWGKSARIDYGDGRPVTVSNIAYEDYALNATLACLKRLEAVGAITLINKL